MVDHTDRDDYEPAFQAAEQAAQKRLGCGVQEDGNLQAPGVWSFRTRRPGHPKDRVKVNTDTEKVTVRSTSGIVAGYDFNDL